MRYLRAINRLLHQADAPVGNHLSALQKLFEVLWRHVNIAENFAEKAAADIQAGMRGNCSSAAVWVDIAAVTGCTEWAVLKSQTFKDCK